MSTTDTVISIQLSPAAAGNDADTILLGITLVPVLEPGATQWNDIAQKLAALKNEWVGDRPDFKAYAGLVATARKELPALFGWREASNIRVVLRYRDQSDAWAEVPATLVANPMLEAASREALVAAHLKRIGELTEGFTKQLCGFEYPAGDIELDEASFNLFAQQMLILRAPSPIPHDAHGLAYVVTVSRAALSVAQANAKDGSLYASVEHADLAWAGAVVAGDDARAEVSYTGAWRCRGYSMPLQIDDLLREKGQAEGFVDPYVSLWLDRVDHRGRDWQSAFPRVVESMVEPLPRLIEAIRVLAERIPQEDLFDVAWYRRAVLATLRQSLGVGFYVSAPDTLPALQLARMLDEIEDESPETARMLRAAAGTTSVADPAVLLQAAFAKREMSLDFHEWYATLRAAMPALALPEDVAEWLGRPCTAAELLDELANLAAHMLEDGSRIAIQLHEWERALSSAPALSELLRRARIEGPAVWMHADLGALARRVAALSHAATAAPGAVAMAARDGFDGFEQLVAEHVRGRLLSSSHKPPVEEALPRGLDAALAEVAQVAADAARRVLSKDAKSDPEPQPMTIQFDRLSDDGPTQKLNDRSSESLDINQLLMGYGVMMRAVRVGANGDDEDAWRHPLVGVVRQPIWHHRDVLLEDNAPLRAIAHVSADAIDGVRQVMLRHDNEPWVGYGDHHDVGPKRGIFAVEVLDTDETKLPMLGFGLAYDVLLHAQALGGGLPRGYRDGAMPHVLPTQLPDDAPEKRTPTRFTYPRRVLVGCVRPFVNVDVLHVPLEEAMHNDYSGPCAVPANYPLLCREAANAPHLALHASVRTDEGDANAPALVLLNQSGWQSIELTLRAPAASPATWERWWAYRAFRDPRYRRWLVRIDAAARAGRLVREEGGEVGAVLRALLEPLDDPAVTALLITVDVIRGEAAGASTHVLPLTRAFEDVQAEPATEKTLKSLAADLERVVASIPKLKFMLDNGPRVAERSGSLEIRFAEGEIARVTVTPLVAAADYDRQFAADLIPYERLAINAAEWVPCHGADVSFWVEAPATTMPSDAELHGALRASVDAVGVVRLHYEAPARAAGSISAWDHVGDVKPRWQAWRPDGRPRNRMPPIAGDSDWEVHAFAEREAAGGRGEPPMRVALAQPTQLVRIDIPAERFAAQYFRLTATATSRYAVLFERVMGKRIPPVVAKGPDPWHRVVRSGRWDGDLPPPVVKLVLPLMRGEGPQTRSGDLIVLLNESWGALGGLAESFEVSLEQVRGPTEDGVTEAKLYSQNSPDPIEVADAGRPIVGLGHVGPFGHTFDLDLPNPLFIASSFIVKVEDRLDPGSLVKLQFRRLLEPSAMSPYASGERVLTEKACDPERLDAVGEGIISFERIDVPKVPVTGTFRFADAVVDVEINATLVTAHHAGRTDNAPIDGAPCIRAWVRLISRAMPDSDKKSQWELAVYARAAAPADARPFWRRLATALCESAPADRPTLSFKPSATVTCGVVSVLEVRRSSPLAGEAWAQTQRDTRYLAIDGPWLAEKTSGTALEPKALRFRLTGSGTAIEFVGAKGQALDARTRAHPYRTYYHRALLMRRVVAADGSEGLAYVATLKPEADGSTVFAPVASGTSLPADVSQLVAFGMLWQGREDLPTPDDPFDAMFGDGTRQDARARGPWITDEITPE